MCLSFDAPPSEDALGDSAAVLPAEGPVTGAEPASDEAAGPEIVEPTLQVAGETTSDPADDVMVAPIEPEDEPDLAPEPDANGVPEPTVDEAAEGAETPSGDMIAGAQDASGSAPGLSDDAAPSAQFYAADGADQPPAEAATVDDPPQAILIGEVDPANEARHEAPETAMEEDAAEPYTPENDPVSEVPPTEDAASNVVPLTRVLAAEDNKTNQIVFKKMLGTAQIELTMTEDGAQLLEAYLADRPDIVFTDISMPGMDGLEATRLIRAFEKEHNLPQVPIVAMTAHNGAEERERAADAGVTAYLAKPLRKAALLEKLGAFVPAALPNP